MTRSLSNGLMPNRPRHSAVPPLTNALPIGNGLLAAGAVVAVAAGILTGTGVGPTATADIAAVRPAAAAAPVVTGPIQGEQGPATGSVGGGSVVIVTGSSLDRVASVRFGDQPGAVTAATADTVTITTPPAADRATGTVAVELFDIEGKAVAVEQAETVDAALASLPAESAAAAETAPAQLAFEYIPDPGITAQIDYALAHWNNYNTAQFGMISGNDCVNFTSQSLYARGWAMDGEWSYGGSYSAAWASSTAFANYLSRHPERATALTDAQRDQVKVGDVVQFDWDNSGDRDHTGIVTRIDQTASGPEVFYAGHTNNTDFKSVSESVRNTGASVSYWSIA